MEKEVQFHVILKHRRELSGLTQVEMAKKLGVARQTYLDLETGKTEPRLSTLKSLSLIFNVPGDYWFGEMPKDVQFNEKTVKELVSELYRRTMLLDDA